MSGLLNVTYSELVERIKSGIKTKCHNIADYANISNVFKTGFTGTYTIPGGNDYATCYCTYAISGNPISQVAASTVDTDMTNFISNIGLTQRINNNVVAGEFINFINDMVSFCSTKLAFSVSQYAPSTRYLIYTGNTSYPSLVNITSENLDKIIVTNDSNEFSNAIINITKNTIRTIPCTYSITYS
jgi:hypothetical protein